MNRPTRYALGMTLGCCGLGAVGLALFALYMSQASFYSRQDPGATGGAILLAIIVGIPGAISVFVGYRMLFRAIRQPPPDDGPSGP